MTRHKYIESDCDMKHTAEGVSFVALILTRNTTTQQDRRLADVVGSQECIKKASSTYFAQRDAGCQNRNGQSFVRQWLVPFRIFERDLSAKEAVKESEVSDRKRDPDEPPHQSNPHTIVTSF